eukprot:gnl/MRDRNA2_/MRDRNA2_117099_c0_seq1.p1 gnl/MRDRNA2_/MRDRNA2_117099_c0~~gnl/MRDRNA2_/MRDRNA2_117099_c0_seq1.p1  ORF type:complete len:331 (+),score=59.29 gnl/MRDRNA2_/MRDRNA2_117099_c0_seq1:134-1126(+)
MDNMAADSLSTLESMKQPGTIFPGRMSGEVSRFDESGQNFGYIECHMIKTLFQNDVLVTWDEMHKSRLQLGDKVQFLVEINKSGAPQAKDIENVESQGTAASAAPAAPAVPAPRGLLARNAARQQAHAAQQMQQSFPLDPLAPLASVVPLTNGLPQPSPIAAHIDPFASPMAPIAPLVDQSQNLLLWGTMPSTMPGSLQPDPFLSFGGVMPGTMPSSLAGTVGEYQQFNWMALSNQPNSGAHLTEQQLRARSRSREKVKGSNEGKPKKEKEWFVGQPLRYWVREKNKWVSTHVVAVGENGAVQLSVRPGVWLDKEEQNASCRTGRPALKQ